MTTTAGAEVNRARLVATASAAGPRPAITCAAGVADWRTTRRRRVDDGAAGGAVVVVVVGGAVVVGAAVGAGAVVVAAGGAVAVTVTLAIVVGGAAGTVCGGSGSAVEYVQLAVTNRRAIASARMNRR